MNWCKVGGRGGGRKNGKHDCAHELLLSIVCLQSKDCAQCWNQGKNGNQGGPNAVRVSEETKASNGMAQHMEQSSPGTEWFSQVELGVFVTFIALSNGGNALKRIRFRYSPCTCSVAVVV
jgi:hypothetical protein